MSDIPTASMRFREHLVQTRTLIIVRTITEQGHVYVLRSEAAGWEGRVLISARGAQIKQFLGAEKVLRFLDKWGMGQVTIPFRKAESVNHLSVDECAAILEKLRQPRATDSGSDVATAPLKAAINRHPTDWGPVSRYLAEGMSPDRISRLRGVPLPTILYIIDLIKKPPSTDEP
ncbi:hypothetical protein [Paenirhodobacter populi]|uniref:Uncharacterized protein n=1 Tax=Paenirhodobacter populi TaxID=2306993 RepID=A0A443JR27_9RHOB|nr:hypothetical protein [Sinirhodobacter populi]RWR22965.1 hypothetical protein D2T30_04880 [Sinirhodobacter populi]